MLRLYLSFKKFRWSWEKGTWRQKWWGVESKVQFLNSALHVPTESRFRWAPNVLVLILYLVWASITNRLKTDKENNSRKNLTFLKLHISLYMSPSPNKNVCVEGRGTRIIILMRFCPGLHFLKYIYQTCSFLWPSYAWYLGDFFPLFVPILKKKKEDSPLGFWKEPKTLAQVSTVPPNLLLLAHCNSKFLFYAFNISRIFFF